MLMQVLFLGAFATLRKTTISFVLSIYLHGTAKLELKKFL
jgi:hypothetical protein